MECLKNCIFMKYIKPLGKVMCLISRRPVDYGCTCPYGNMTVTELNMKAGYNRRRNK